jgi:CRISPR system Cascade subunit CasE
MYLSRLILNPLNREVQKDLANCHELHRTILQAFPPTRNGVTPREKYNVLHRVDIDHQTGTPTILIQSDYEPHWEFLSDKKGYLLEDIDEPKYVKQIYDSLQYGQILTFRLRANPTKKVDTKTHEDGKKRNGRREPLRTEEERISWLIRKAKIGGFEIVSVKINKNVLDIRLLSEQATQITHGTKKEKSMTFSSILFDGNLRITDVDEFQKTLHKGIGSAKAYGFGLLSIRKPV